MLKQAFGFRLVDASNFRLVQNLAGEKQAAELVADENFSYCRRVGKQALSTQARDSPVARNWRRRLVGFALVELMPIQCIVRKEELVLGMRSVSSILCLFIANFRRFRHSYIK